MKKITSILAVGALALTLIVPASFAATTDKEGDQGKAGFRSWQRINVVRGMNQEQLLELVEKYAPEFQDDFQSIWEQMQDGRKFPQLDEATKEKLAEIQAKVKDGSLTREEAQAALEELGIKARAVHLQLDEATKEKLAEIQAKVKDGSLTREEAQAALEELGIKARAVHLQLDEATKEKLAEIQAKVKDGSLTREEAQAALEELGI
ncbi:MAG: hypothetical protein ACOWWO_19995, partial [Peptococcaceae bacterium]